MLETLSRIEVQVNGDVREIADGSSIVALLSQLNRDPEMQGVAVAVNDSVVRRADWPLTFVQESDRVEIITASQGG